MYCKKCGSMIPDDSEVCQYCGTVLREGNNVPTNANSNANTTQNGNVRTYQSNVCAILAFIISFILPLFLCSLILGIVGLAESKNMGGSGRGLAIVAIVISLWPLWVIILVVLIGMLVTCNA